MIRNKVVKDTTWNIMDYFSTLVIFLVTTKILIGQIGTDGYGFYMFFTSLIGTFGLVDLGMGMAVSKYLSEFLHHNKFDEANQVITIAFFFYLLIGIFILSAVCLFNSNIINFLNFDNQFFNIGSTVLLLTVIIFIINMISTIMTNILVALEEWKRLSLVNILMKILNAVILIYILVLDMSVEKKISYIFYLLLCFSIFKFFIYFIYAKKSLKYLCFSYPTLDIKKKMLNFLKISSFQYGFSLVGGHLDKFIISKYFGLEALGIYSFVVNYFVYLHGLLINIFKIILPKISKLHGDNDIYNLNNILKKSLKYSLYLSIFLSVFSLLIWESFISFYIDNKFAINSYVYIQLFMILLIVRSFDPVFFYYFNAIAKPFFLLLGVIIVSSITVIGYLIFVRIFEIYGLIISQILAALTVNIYFFYLTSKKENYYEK